MELTPGTSTLTPTTCRCCSAARPRPGSCWPSCHQGPCGSEQSGVFRWHWEWCLSCTMGTSPIGAWGKAPSGTRNNSHRPTQRHHRHPTTAQLHRSSGPNTGPCACSSTAPSAAILWRCSSFAMTSTAAPSNAWWRSINASAARSPTPRTIHCPDQSWRSARSLNPISASCSINSAVLI